MEISKSFISRDLTIKYGREAVDIIEAGSYRASSGRTVNLASRSTPRMMQVTRAAFQADPNLNEQVTNPKSHTPVRNFYTRFFPLPLSTKFRW
jgi:hypothetical protein